MNHVCYEGLCTNNYHADLFIKPAYMDPNCFASLVEVKYRQHGIHIRIIAVEQHEPTNNTWKAKWVLDGTEP